MYATAHVHVYVSELVVPLFFFFFFSIADLTRHACLLLTLHLIHLIPHVVVDEVMWLVSCGKVVFSLGLDAVLCAVSCTVCMYAVVRTLPRTD